MEVKYPDDKPLTAAEKLAVFRGRDRREWWRRWRASQDEEEHSPMPKIDLDDPVELAEEYWDIWG